MNRILLEKGEIGDDGTATLCDERAAHIINVLHSVPGDTLKTGEVDGAVGTSEVVAVGENRVALRPSHTERALAPWADLVLAPPRPRAMKRLLPQLAAMGVGRIILVGAQKVEKDFWGATLLKEEIYRPLLVDGLMQAGTAALPQIIVRRRLRAFLEDELDALAPSPVRIIAHPYGEENGANAIGGPSPTGRITLAVGPEGGWTDREVEMFEARGFKRFSLGGRILRTDTALISLLAIFAQRFDARDLRKLKVES